MEKILLAVSDAFAEAPNVVLRFRLWVLVGLLLVTVFMGWGIYTRTSIDMSPDSFLDQSDPAIAALDKFRSQFGSDDSMFLVYRAKDGNVFSRESLTAIAQLTDELRYWQNLNPADFPAELDGQPVDLNELGHIRRVQSIANLRLQESVDDSLLSQRLVPSPLPESEAELAAVRERALAQDDYLLAFYSADASYGGVLLQTDFGARPVEDYTPAVDASGITLDDSFLDFNDTEVFNPSFDETATVQEVEFQDVDMFGYASFSVAARALYSRYDEQFEFYPAGNPPMMEFMMDVFEEMMLLFILMVLIFILMLWILFRSFSAVLWPMIAVAMSMCWSWGIIVWLGVPITSMVSLTVMLVFAVGIADCVHIMSAYFSFRRSGLEHYTALSKSYGKTGLAILVTTITTCAGVLALTTSELVPIQVFAVMSALGVALALVFCVLLLPILLDVWHPGNPDQDASFADRLGKRWTAVAPRYKWIIAAGYALVVFGLLGMAIGGYVLLISLLTYVVVNWQDEILARVPHIVAAQPWLWLSLFAVLFVVCAYGTSRVRIDSNMAELFREGSVLRIVYEVVDNNMAGAQNMEIMIDTGATDGLLDPDVLQAVDTLQQRIETRYPQQVSRTNSLANIVKDTYQVMNNDDPAYYRIPDSRQMVSQLLYLFNSANPEDRRSLVSDDYSRSHISVNAYNAGSYQYQQLFTELSVDVDELFGGLRQRFPEMDVQLTGTMALLMRMSDEMAHSQFNSFALAIGLISLIMIITLGSLQGGLMAMIPNLIPALLGFGLMGLLGVPLDTDTLLMAPLIMGIAVDDTVHFMTHYRVELARTGSISEALGSAIREVGQAVMFTTMILGLGFALLSFSGYLGMAKMGFFGSAAIFVALLCDLFLIPAMVIIFKPTFGVRDADKRIIFRESPA
ncbi:MAG: efflux RND transporter permease subunit [Pseudohongiellaceae bacterium]